MAAEIELKLSIHLESKENFCHRLDLLGQHIKPSTTQQLFNRYFDTADGTLNQHRIALRIRKAGEQYIQTLKTRGLSQGGLHQRQEWEWDVKRPELEPALLPIEALPEHFAPQQLIPLFDTDFERTTWYLNHEGTQLELVLDQGQVRLPQYPELTDSISEIELELVKGTPEALFDLAIKLATQIPLRITQISKAERGYRLLRRAGVALGADRQLMESNSLGAALEDVQTAIESWLFEDTATHQLQRTQALQTLANRPEVTESQHDELIKCAKTQSPQALQRLEFCQTLLDLAQTSYLMER